MIKLFSVKVRVTCLYAAPTKHDMKPWTANIAHADAGIVLCQELAGIIAYAVMIKCLDVAWLLEPFSTTHEEHERHLGAGMQGIMAFPSFWSSIWLASHTYWNVYHVHRRSKSRKQPLPMERVSSRALERSGYRKVRTVSNSAPAR